MAQTNVQRLIDLNGGPSGPTYTPTTTFASMKFDDFDRILTSATTPTTAIENVSAAWKHLALLLRSNIVGRPLAFNGSADPFANGFPTNSQGATDSQGVLSKLDKSTDGTFDSLLASLAGWQGTAADAFLSKALEVRSFALGLAQRFYASDNGAMYAGNAWNGCEFNYTVASMAKALAPTQDIYRQLKPWYESTVVQNLWDFLAGKQAWNGMNLQIGGPPYTLTSIHGYTSTISVTPTYGPQKSTIGVSTSGSAPTGFTFVYESHRNFQSTTDNTYLNGVSYTVSGAVSGSMTTGPTTVTFAPDADRSGPFAYLGGTCAIGDVRAVYSGQKILYTVLAGQHHARLTELLTITAREYVWGATQMPDTPTPPKDVSTGGSTSSSNNTNTPAPPLPPGPTNPTPPKYPTPHTTPLSGPSTGATGHPLTSPSGQPAGLGGTNIGKSGTGGSTAGYTPIPSSPYHPGTLSPESGHLGDFGKGTSAFDNGKLASFTPGAGAGFGGGALGPSGLGGPATGGLDAGAGGASGIGGPGGGFGQEAAGPAGAGAGAGAAGMAGRGGMPMAPMGGGAGGGRESKERQRKAFLTEDDDVWGADGGEAPAVL